MLVKIADNYEADVDVAVEGVSSLIEPMIIGWPGWSRRVHRDLALPAADRNYQEY